MVLVKKEHFVRSTDSLAIWLEVSERREWQDRIAVENILFEKDLRNVDSTLNAMFWSVVWFWFGHVAGWSEVFRCRKCFLSLICRIIMKWKYDLVLFIWRDFLQFSQLLLTSLLIDDFEQRWFELLTVLQWVKDSLADWL